MNCTRDQEDIGPQRKHAGPAPSYYEERGEEQVLQRSKCFVDEPVSHDRATALIFERGFALIWGVERTGDL